MINNGGTLIWNNTEGKESTEDTQRFFDTLYSELEMSSDKTAQIYIQTEDHLAGNILAEMDGKDISTNCRSIADRLERSGTWSMGEGINYVAFRPKHRDRIERLEAIRNAITIISEWSIDYSDVADGNLLAALIDRNFNLEALAPGKIDTSKITYNEED